MSLDTTVLLICGILLAICGPFCIIDDLGGWDVMWAVARRRRKAKAVARGNGKK